MTQKLAKPKPKFLIDFSKSLCEIKGKKVLPKILAVIFSKFITHVNTNFHFLWFIDNSSLKHRTRCPTFFIY